MFVGRIVAAGAVLVVAAVVTPCLAGSADRASTALEVRKQGEVSYVSGGVGDEDQKVLAAIAKDFNLKVTFASPSGQYAGGSRVEIRDQSNSVVLDAEARGPLLYVDLPPGTYTVSTMDAGRAAQKKTVQLAANGRAEVLFNTEQAERDPDTSDSHSARSTGGQ